VKNQDLWQGLLAAAEVHQIDWRWTKGHAGDELNERADTLASAEAAQVTAQDPADQPA
jgi:ribonuclease HI